MSLKNAKQKLATAQATYEKVMKSVVKSVRDELVESIAAVLPEGWFISWSQSDNQYDDENYHFGVQAVWLATERLPKRGKMIKAAVAEVSEQRAGGYGGTYKHITTHEKYAEYAWSMDPKGKKRSGVDTDEDGDDYDVSVFDLLHGGPPRLELRVKDYAALSSLMGQLADDEKLIRAAFGDVASVTIWKNGKVKVS